MVDAANLDNGDSMTGDNFFTVDNVVNRVMKTHKRKESQFQSLKEELGLVFDEEEAERIATKTMKEINPNFDSTQKIQIKNIVNKARKEHKRKVSQFQAIKHDILQYFPNEHESMKLAAEIMKEYNPNNKSDKKSEDISIDSIVQKAVTQHKRKKSVFKSIENDLGLIYDDADVKNITKNVMKKIFAQKQAQNNNTDHIEKMRQEIQELKYKLYQKDKQIQNINQQLTDAIESKNNLATNSSQALDEMRGYLLQYQQSVFKTDS
eukprot:157432_1